MPRTFQKPFGAFALDRSGLGRNVRCALLMDGTRVGTADVKLRDYARNKFISGASNGTSMSKIVGIGGQAMLGTTAAHFIICDDESEIFGTETPVGVTIGMIRRKVDTTLRSATHFGFRDSTNSADRMSSHMPLSNGNVYWDHGSTTDGAGRLIWVGGYAVTTNIEYWLMHAGPRGSAIWLDGINRASNADATMLSGTAGRQFFLNQARGSTTEGDEVEVYLFFVADKQWSDGQIREWFRRPYASLFSPIVRPRYSEQVAAASDYIGARYQMPGVQTFGGRQAA